MILFLSCEEETENYKPLSSGRINSVSVITDKVTWESKVGNEIRNIFASEFWNHHLPVYSDEKTIASRYKNNRNELVTEYAATNPAEDIAESFAEYVLAEQLPKPTSIANRKIRFFLTTLN